MNNAKQRAKVIPMFDILQFGAYLSRLRKSADMTQSELADQLNVTRQAISKYERGESFPDISILLLIADVFSITVESLIHSGGPTKAEADLLLNQSENNGASLKEILNIAPLLKPSILDRLSDGLARQGIDISHLVVLSEYMNSDNVAKLLEEADFDHMDNELLIRLIPFINDESKLNLLEKLINGDLDTSFIKPLLRYADSFVSLIEAAVLDGSVDKKALSLINEYTVEEQNRRNNQEGIRS